MHYSILEERNKTLKPNEVSSRPYVPKQNTFPKITNLDVGGRYNKRYIPNFVFPNGDMEYFEFLYPQTYTNSDLSISCEWVLIRIYNDKYNK